MAYKERINKKTGKKEYKVRYYFNAQGKKRDSETGWFTSLEKAEKEAEALKRKKEAEDQLRIQNNTNKTIDTVYYEYVEYLKEEYERNKSVTNKSYYNLGKTVYNLHIPFSVRSTKIKDADANVFRTWMYKVNKEGESGSTIRNYKKTILRFNDWLSENNYYSDEFIRDYIFSAVSRVKLKGKTENNRIESGERNTVTFDDIENIGKYFIEKGLGNFKNFYYYTFFYVLFFSGVRPEEIVGLQWKHIKLADNERLIQVFNSISILEDKDEALKRTRKGKNKVKTKTSKREIPIFTIYLQLLKDYKESYKYHFDVSNENELNEGFVFPSLGKNDIHECMRTDTALKELKRVIAKLGIPNTDLQMFRHSCATYLILPKPKGLGYSYEQIVNYFGHVDTSMLRLIYTQLNYIEKREQLQSVFNGKEYQIEKTEQMTEQEKAYARMQERMNGDNEAEQGKARKDRIFSQINKVIKDGKSVYEYSSKDKEIIEEYKTKHKTCKLEFKEKAT